MWFKNMGPICTEIKLEKEQGTSGKSLVQVMLQGKCWRSMLNFQFDEAKVSSRMSEPSCCRRAEKRLNEQT